ncbi:DUF2922 domain-containing protein [Jeotgalibaca ciconiae]|uniref:DUF2922 domain-containing protein n=1 Tax=Jeotgalibaca ciconiae TaxID=2496265 RepID=A0A3Q9BLW7_9LACT|nr:DUF2922 domain-containing protein [Jeotgalibaca ciconiae]AZP04963.1 DUF2922 domain-containing protein [Jeotgalibaca ciconiae]HJB24688.1 DUF2922 domain-containing protein [Candidatus Jeotgalibaca pullicola]
MNTNVTLELKFKTAEGKTRNLSLKNPVTDLTSEQVQPAMEAIIELDAFEVKGVNPYAGLDSARYVERVVTDIFNTEE